MQVKTISARSTFAAKFLFTTLSISVSGLAMLGLWSGVLHGRNNVPADVEFKYLFSALCIMGDVFALRLCGGLKRVRVDDKNIYVSNYLHEIIVPLSDISNVTENFSLNIHPITIHLKNKTDFGFEIIFMPETRFFDWGGSYPIVAELKQLAGLGG